MNLLLVVDESTQLIYASRSLPQTHPVQEKVQHEWLLHFLPLLATQHVLQQELDGEQLRHVQSEDGSRLFLYSLEGPWLMLWLSPHITAPLPFLYDALADLCPLLRFTYGLDWSRQSHQALSMVLDPFLCHLSNGGSEDPRRFSFVFKTELHRTEGIYLPVSLQPTAAHLLQWSLNWITDQSVTSCIHSIHLFCCYGPLSTFPFLLSELLLTALDPLDRRLLQRQLFYQLSSSNDRSGTSFIERTASSTNETTCSSDTTSEIVPKNPSLMEEDVGSQTVYLRVHEQNMTYWDPFHLTRFSLRSDNRSIHLLVLCSVHANSSTASTLTSDLPTSTIKTDAARTKALEPMAQALRTALFQSPIVQPTNEPQQPTESDNMTSPITEHHHLHSTLSEWIWNPSSLKSEQERLGRLFPGLIHFSFTLAIRLNTYHWSLDATQTFAPFVPSEYENDECLVQCTKNWVWVYMHVKGDRCLTKWLGVVPVRVAERMTRRLLVDLKAANEEDILNKE